jgi:hypothetical protein
MTRASFRSVLFTLVIGAATLGASKASAQDANALHLSSFFGLGFGGAWDVDVAGTSTGGDLDATVGLGLRFEVPLLDYLTIGGQLGFNFPKIDGQDDRQKWLDLPDLIVRGRYPVRLGPGVLEPYVGFLIGGTVSMLKFSATGDDIKDTAYGWNVGVLFGAQYFFNDRFGALFEIGWQRHAANHSQSTAFGDIDVSYSANQAVMNFGFTTLF